MPDIPQHIAVCICTYRRPNLLKVLLDRMKEIETGGLFTFSIVVADNDCLKSAEPAVQAFRAESPIPITYCVEPRQNIALARNKAVENAVGDFVAFIDDDEYPTAHWLWALFEARSKYNVDGVLGPVKPHFEDEAPSWVIQGRFYERPSYPTGLVIDWKKGRTGNVLFRRDVFEHREQPFNPEFLVGEDQDFFRRMIGEGRVFIWCDEAVAYETVPPARWKRVFMLRRALLRGRMSLAHPASGLLDIAKSLVAVPLYVVALPIAFLLGQDKFMNLAIRLCDHAGRLLASVGIHPVDEPYVTG